MIKTNFFLQIFFAIILIVILLVSLLSFDSDGLFAVLYLQIPLGISQVLGGILQRILQKNERRHLSVYLLSVIFNLGIIPFNKYLSPSVREVGIIFSVVALPWVLASYYGFISYRLFKNQSTHG
ncbi:MAG: hypothetical protein AAF843_11640 [Bacteroidota bacterium]